MLTEKQIADLNVPLPAWAVKPHPTKTNMSAIHPMAVIDRLNSVFGVGRWMFKTEYLACNSFTQKTKNGDRSMYMSAVKGILAVQDHDIHIEQFGGSSNDDMGDALKGGATDALTKCASYLGVGASIYKGQGNVEPPAKAAVVPAVTFDQAMTMMGAAKTVEELVKTFKGLPAALQNDPEIIAKGAEVKELLTN